jgi:uncharacterized protein YacL
MTIIIYLVFASKYICSLHFFTWRLFTKINLLNMQIEKFSYDNKIVKYFAIATVVWGTIGMLVGIIIATLMFYPSESFW